MPREFSRPQRVSEQLQRELALLIQRELKDPRLGMVTVAAVDVSRDLAYATVYVIRAFALVPQNVRNCGLVD